MLASALISCLASDFDEMHWAMKAGRIQNSSLNAANTSVMH